MRWRSGAAGSAASVDGPARDAVLQVRYVSAAGDVVKGGGPTVKNVSGFDLRRLLVGSRGTLGFLGDVILRTRPRARCERWYAGADRPVPSSIARLYRPTSVLWDGTTTWVLLEGDERDVDGAGRPARPGRGRRSAAAADRRALVGAARTRSSLDDRGVRRRGRRRHRPPHRAGAAAARRPGRSSTCTGGSRSASTPPGRLNPGVDPLAP